MGMGRNGIPFRNIVMASIEYCGDDVEKLSYIFEFLSYLIEKKAEEQIDQKKDNFKFDYRQKKLELKVDDTVLKFTDFAQKLGYSVSGMLVSAMAKFFGIDNKVFRMKRPKQKKIGNKDTVSLKLPMDIYYEIKNKVNEPLNVVARKVMKYFIESKEKFLAVSEKD